MIILKIAAVSLGLMFLMFGYAIYFKEKYNLINGFEADFQRGFKDEAYARRVGVIELAAGAALLASGITLIVFA